jgi:hypothetical protein
MSSLPNPNLLPESSLIQDGQLVYDTQLRVLLEPDHMGEFVAVEPLSERYFLGKSATAALVAARDAMPESQFFLTRVGRNAAHKIGGHGAGIRQS